MIKFYSVKFGFSLKCDVLKITVIVKYESSYIYDISTNYCVYNFKFELLPMEIFQFNLHVDSGSFYILTPGFLVAIITLSVKKCTSLLFPEQQENSCVFF